MTTETLDSEQQEATPNIPAWLQVSKGRGRGFASMTPERRREIASMGGRTGGRHVFSSEEAQEAGRKGGANSWRRRRK